MTEDHGTFPNVGVAPVREFKGMNSLEDKGIPLLTVKPFIEAFSERYETDAHYCTYIPWPHPIGESWPRCNKSALSQLRTLKTEGLPNGIDLYATMLVIDYDTPRHEKLTAGALSTFLEQLETLAETWSIAWQWTVLHSTKHGVRLVYVLDKPVSVDIAEQHHQWLCQEFNERGLRVDLNVSDWTRLFRLPWVSRVYETQVGDKIEKVSIPTWTDTDPPMEMIRQYDNRLAVDLLGKREAKYTDPQRALIAPVIPLNLPRPEDETAVALIESLSSEGKFASTQWWSLAKRHLRGRECYEWITGEREIQKGNRDATLLRYVGQSIGVLAKTVPQTTPAHIYGMFFSAVSQLEPDAGTPNWYDCLWSAVCRIWSIDEAKAAGIAAVQIESIETADAMIRSMARGMRKRIVNGKEMGWCEAEILQHSEAPKESSEFSQLQSWLLRRLMVSTPRGFTLMMSDGYYDRVELQKHQIVMRWRHHNLDVISPTRVFKDNGKGYKDVTAEQLMNQHGLVVSDVQGRAALDGAIVDRIETPNPSLIMPLYSRSKYIEATASYDPDVDQWLKHFFGENYQEGCDWIRWSLDFEAGPIAALSIQGAAGAGKKLFVQGLAECLAIPALASGQDLTGKYGYGLLTSPFLVVNEGWPEGETHGSAADSFRHVVGGDPIRVDRKFLSPVEIRSPLRVIFTANNMDVLRGLVGNRDLSPEDRLALFIRIIHYNIGNDAAEWLKAKGGLFFTATPGRRWIAGDSGQESDYVVARHFMHLYLTRPPVPPGSHERLLVQGGKNPEIMFDMRTNSGRAPLVIETILRMMDSPKAVSEGSPFGMTIEGTKVYVLTSAVIEYAREFVRPAGNLTIQQVTSVLKGLVEHEVKSPIALLSRLAVGRKRWHDLDINLLKTVADRDGIICKKLDQVHEKFISDKLAKLPLTVAARMIE